MNKDHATFTTANAITGPLSNESSVIQSDRNSRRLFLSGLVAGAGSLALAACGGGGSEVGAPDGTVAEGVARRQRPNSGSSSTNVNPAITNGRLVTTSFFGMHFSSAAYAPWPTVNFEILRTWDQWPGVSWADLNPSNGTYNWANLDAVVNAAINRGVEIVYTFGYVPSWASSNASGDCAGGLAGSCYAPDLTAWRNFVTQITTRYKGKIKYWELWNEPNAQNFWQGTPGQLVTMASTAYSIIKNSGGMVLSPAPQGTNAHLWLDSYFAAGGVPYSDIVSFHGYLHGAPELIVPLVTNIKSVMTKYGLGAAPLWDTEHSWGDASWPFGATQDQQAAWLARYIVLSFTSNVERSLWYMYDSAQWGTLSDRTTKQIFTPGVAYQQINKWMMGASMSPGVLSGDVYQCHLTRAAPYEALIVWNVNAMDSQLTNFLPPPGFTQYQRLDGVTVSIPTGTQVPIGMKPILIEKIQ